MVGVRCEVWCVGVLLGVMWECRVWGPPHPLPPADTKAVTRLLQYPRVW